MSNSGNTPNQPSPPGENNSAQVIAELLRSAVPPIERNDLGRLARMHSLCESLASAPDFETNPAVHQIAAELVKLLEGLILDEAGAPDAGIELIPRAAAALDAAHRGESVDAAGLVAQMEGALSGDAVTTTAPASVESASTPQPSAPEPVAVVSQPAPRTSTADASASQIEAYVAEPLHLGLEERETLEGFLEESREHLDSIEGALLEVEGDPTDTAKINELFRPFHTIKGIAGFLNLRDINRLTHEVETILDQARKGEHKITSATIDLIFAAIDILTAQIAAIREYMAAPSGDAVPQPNIVEIMVRLRTVSSGGQPPESSPAADGVTPTRTGEILVAEGATEPEVVDLALEKQEQPTEQRKVGEILVDMGTVTRKQVGKALSKQVAAKESPGKAVEQAIRVDTRKLDILVDAVGELVIAQTMVNLNTAVTTNEKLTRDVSQVTKIVRDVQETAMAMRMVPVGGTFQKMRRLIRDVARKAGKEVELIINGNDTEVDKNVIQQISDPLVHMVRNAVDHGIESAAERLAAGKPEIGQVKLDAYHQGDSIVIEISDDGHGLDREKLIAKGIERGLISPDDQLSDQQVFALVLQPGFSTAAEVTDISGRGVGMDVVKRNIEQLRGKIEIESELGKGSTFRIRLPLTLAIIDGMLLGVGNERLIFPTILIEQSLRPEPSQITTVQNRGEMIQVRGELSPLIQLGELFGYCGHLDPCEAIVVIALCGDRKIGLVVNELIGQQQVVIKALGERFKKVNGISGAAILGDGRVGLILEPTGLLALYNETHGPSDGITTANTTGDNDSDLISETNAAAAEPAVALT